MKVGSLMRSLFGSTNSPKSQKSATRRAKGALFGVLVLAATPLGMRAANGADPESSVASADVATADAVTDAAAAGCAVDLGTCLIGNQVFLDANNSGIYETGESGVVGTPVHLWNNNVETDKSTVTGANGLYSFFGLTPSDSYQVCVDIPTGYRGSNGSGDLTPGQDDTTAPDPNNFVDNDDNGRISVPAGRLCSGYITVGGDISANGRVDFGIYQPGYSVGNQVFNDANNNGIYENGEKGIAGAMAHLWENNADTGKTSTTDADGNYSFYDLNPSTSYQVCVDIPTGYRGSNGSGSLAAGQDDPVAPDPNNYLDNDDNGRISSPAGRLCSGYVTLSGGTASNGRVDFGMYSLTEASATTTAPSTTTTKPASTSTTTTAPRSAQAIADTPIPLTPPTTVAAVVLTPTTVASTAAPAQVTVATKPNVQIAGIQITNAPEVQIEAAPAVDPALTGSNTSTLAVMATLLIAFGIALLFASSIIRTRCLISHTARFRAHSEGLVETHS